MLKSGTGKSGRYVGQRERLPKKVGNRLAKKAGQAMRRRQKGRERDSMSACTSSMGANGMLCSKSAFLETWHSSGGSRLAGLRTQVVAPCLARPSSEPAAGPSVPRKAKLEDAHEQE